MWCRWQRARADAVNAKRRSHRNISGSSENALKQPPLLRKEIVDIVVREATFGLFIGDRRDGAAPPITLENFANEMMRYGSQALRARLSRLPDAALLSEALAALQQVEARQKQLQANVGEGERLRREDEMRAIQARFAEYGRRRGLQPAILAAARHYRGRSSMSAKSAWRTIKQNPFKMCNGEIVIIEGNGVDEIMRVTSQRSKQRKGVKQPQWLKRYWPAARS
jgi:hypothetical protein